ncbi:sigma-54-dependent Fis family transcriptional regulator [Permianibacter sp. IMCC34836]|uniref:sigma-54-dependent transcriptional regulator n=1 Tax=Permianibacter fluminis TaxID=2738515 RepID=UPI001554E276|nr:sigma-54 dependent transcriptional regulator [Permianibacter fluminis]NQD38443.1 sigma-54-dependent Fis family transcriptional regulator [Permianibacter fluminis]
MTATILIADDDSSVLSALRLQLKAAGYRCDTVSTPAEALAALKKSDYALLLMDLNYDRDTTSGNEGMALIRAVRALDTDLPIVAMTGWGTIDIAVSAMRSGANDFIEKPWDNTRLNTIIHNLIQLGSERRGSARLSQENALLKQAAQHDSWLGQSAPMQQLMKKAASVAGTDINILLTGENGTGKSQLAQWLHQHSARHARSLVNVNMGAIPENLFESELFGHQKGAFTDAKETRLGRFELADGGTLFLDEVGNLPLPQQAKLLRVLESGQFEKVGSSRSQHVDVRIIAATNADLPALVRDGKFRQDLLYRLNGIELHVPALRERDSDIDLLADHFCQLYANKYQRDQLTLATDARAALREHYWPGNVRELRHCLERAVLLARGQQIQRSDLALPEPAGHGHVNAAATGAAAATAAPDWSGLTLDEVERQLLTAALKKHDGNAMAAAKALGLSRSAFYRRLEKFQL